MRALLALLVGALVAVSFSPFSWWFLLAPAFIALFFLWRDANAWAAFGIGLMFGLGQFGIGVSWVYVSIQTFGGMPPPLAWLCVLAFVLVLSLFPAFAGMAQSVFKGWGLVSRSVIIMPVAYLGFEWLRGWILSGFPWLTTGYAMLETPLAGWAPVGGVYLLSLITLMSIGGLLAVLARFSANTVITTVLLASIWLAGGWLQRSPSSLWTRTDGAPIDVAIVQNNVALLDKWETNRRAAIVDEYLQRSIEHQDKDLIVWPEGAIPDYLDNIPAEFWTRLQQHPADFVFGVLYQPKPKSSYYNSMIAVSGRNHMTTYNKQHLVPFGEFFPLQQLLQPVLQYLTIPMADFTPWRSKQAPLAVAGTAAAASICYEDAFPDEWRNQVSSAGMLINISEDTWFGDSLAPHQRLQMARFRAREFERPMVRSSNNGLSALIDWRGRIDAIAPQFEKVVVEGKVQPRTGDTLYTQFGDLLALVTAAVLLVGALLFRRRLR